MHTLSCSFPTETTNDGLGLVDVMCGRVMRVAAEALTRRGRRLDDAAVDALTAALRMEAASGYAALVAEMREADEARMGAPMLEAVFAAGCAVMAARALRSCGLV